MNILAANWLRNKIVFANSVDLPVARIPSDSKHWAWVYDKNSKATKAQQNNEIFQSNQENFEGGISTSLIPLQDFSRQQQQ